MYLVSFQEVKVPVLVEEKYWYLECRLSLTSCSAYALNLVEVTGIADCLTTSVKMLAGKRVPKDSSFFSISSVSVELLSSTTTSSKDAP
jgi:hypothetical protein